MIPKWFFYIVLEKKCIRWTENIVRWYGWSRYYTDNQNELNEIVNEKMFLLDEFLNIDETESNAPLLSVLQLRVARSQWLLSFVFWEVNL